MPRSTTSASRPGRRARTLLPIALLAPLGLAVASGPVRYSPEFFQTPLDNGALIAGDEFSTRTAFARTLLYLHLSGAFTDAHRDLFERWLDRPRAPAPASRVLEWRQLAAASGGNDAYFDTHKLRTRLVQVNGRTFNQSSYVENCLQDAFATAIATLDDRRDRYGRDSAPFRRWLTAQQQVFANCAEPALTLPSPPEKDWVELERQDRRYQIAASYFYNFDFQRAAELFREIAADASSPWSGVSRYLVARSLVRDAVANGNDVDANLRAALALYRQMAAEPGYAARFPSVTGMMRYIEIKLDTAGFMRALAQRVLEDPAAVDVAELDDFLFLTEHGDLGRAADGDPALLRWHRLAADRSTETSRDIVAIWQRTQNPAWLYLALSRQQPADDARSIDAYLAGVEALDPSTPGYADMLVRVAELVDASGDAARARAFAEAALDDDAPSLRTSHRNRLRTIVARGSGDPIEYLALAALTPVAMRLDSAGVFFGDPARLQQSTRGAALFPPETVELINRFYTPGMLLDAVDAIDFNAYLRGRLVIAAWVKALLLDDDAAARRAAAHLESEFPSLAAELDEYLRGGDSDFIAARIVLTHPGFSPWVPPGIGRYRVGADGALVFPSTQVALGLRTYNWWCDETPAAGADAATIVDALERRPMFGGLPSDELSRIARMGSQLGASATEFFGPAVIGYARAHPDDPRVPQTLHRVVFATRYACRSGPGEVSRAAFELLHQRYPASEWARETPYWFE